MEVDYMKTDEKNFENFKEEVETFISDVKNTRLEIENGSKEIEEEKPAVTLDTMSLKTEDLNDIVITNFDDEKEEKTDKKKDKKEKKIKNNKPKTKMNKYVLAMMISALLIPAFYAFFIIGKHTSYLIRLPFFFIIIYILVTSVLTFAYSLYKYQKTKNEMKNTRRFKKPVKIVFGVIYALYVACVIFCLVLFYGPSNKFKDWLVTTAMSTMNHQFLCKWFYSEYEIKEVQSRNYVEEPEGSTDTTLIDHELDDTENYNEYEKELLIHEKDEKYKIVKFTVNGANAYIVAIFDPSTVKVEVTKDLGTLGEYVTNMMMRNNAILGINGGGFVEDGYTHGGKPTGITIVNHQIITNNEYDNAVDTGGIIGITDDDVLVLLKNTTAEQALAMGVRDAVSWGPFLIVNGESAHVAGNGGWGGGARSAIGQRRDGTILFLVVDSNAERTSGAGMEDLVSIMERYGAFNAANLDGGTSSVLALPKDIAQSEYNAPCSDYWTHYACAINDPIDAAWIHRTRAIATSFVVTQ